MTTEATFIIRLMASFLIFLPTVCGITLQLLLGIALFKGWHIFRDKSFYLLTVQIMCCDICALLLDLFFAFPLTLTGHQYMGDSIALYYAPLVFEGIAFNGMFMLSFLLTLNRFLVFIVPTLNSKIFTTGGTKMLSVAVWLYDFTFIGLSNFYGCRKEFCKEYFYFFYNCPTKEARSYVNFMYIHCYVFPLLMSVMYVIIYAKLKWYSQNSFVFTKGDIRYLIQTMLICFMLFIEVVSFMSLPFLGLNGYGQYYVNMVLNLILIANNSMAPIVILVCNRDVRLQLKLALNYHKTVAVGVIF